MERNRYFVVNNSTGRNWIVFADSEKQALDAIVSEFKQNRPDLRISRPQTVDSR